MASNYEKYGKPWRKKNKERIKKSRHIAHLKKSYGISLEYFNEMLIKQGGVCAICKKPETQLHPLSGEPAQLCVDHCHKTGKVRKLLCNRCNRVLGAVNDDLDLLKNLTRYLEEVI